MKFQSSLPFDDFVQKLYPKAEESAGRADSSATVSNISWHVENGAGLWWIGLTVERYLLCRAPNWQPLVLDPVRPTWELFKVALGWSDRSLCSENIKTYAQVRKVIYSLHFVALIKVAQRVEWIYRTGVQICWPIVSKETVSCTASPLCLVPPSSGSDIS